jgi:hypothetical protein
MDLNDLNIWAKTQWEFRFHDPSYKSLLHNCHSELVSESQCEILRNSDAEINSA